MYSNFKKEDLLDNFILIIKCSPRIHVNQLCSLSSSFLFHKKDEFPAPGVLLQCWPFLSISVWSLRELRWQSQLVILVNGFLSIYFQDIQFAEYYEHTQFSSRVTTDETLTQIEKGEREKKLLILSLSDKSRKMAILQMIPRRASITALLIFTLYHSTFIFKELFPLRKQDRV